MRKGRREASADSGGIRRRRAAAGRPYRRDRVSEGRACGDAGRLPVLQGFRGGRAANSRPYSKRSRGKGRTLVRGTLLLAGSGLALRGLGILFHTVLTRRIGAEGMGLMGLIWTVGAFAGTLGSSGVRVAALQLTARAFGKGDRAGIDGALRGCLWYGLLVSAAAGAGLILLAEPIAALLLKEVRTAPALRVLGLLLPFPVLTGVIRSGFTARGRVKQLVGVELLERIVSLGLTFALLHRAGDRLEPVCAGVVAGSYGGCALSFCLLWGMYRRENPVRGRAALGTAARQSLPLALNDYLRSGLGTIEQFLIPYGLEKSGSRHTALAAYGMISAMVFPVLWFPSEIIFALSELMVSELARILAQKNHRRLRELVGKSLRYAVFYAVGTAAVLWAGAGYLGEVLFGSAQVGYYLRLFCPMVLFLYLDAMVDGLQKGMGQQLHLVRYNGFTNVIDVLGLWLLLPLFGIGGYLFTYCLSHLVNFFLSLRRLLIVTERPELCEE